MKDIEYSNKIKNTLDSLHYLFKKNKDIMNKDMTSKIKEIISVLKSLQKKKELTIEDKASMDIIEAEIIKLKDTSLI